MMLASPLMPATTFSASHSSEDSLQYKPSRDLEAFNKLLPPPIEFVEGSSSGTLAVAEGKYEPINASPKSQNTELVVKHKTPTSIATPPNPPSTSSSTKTLSTTSLYPGGIDTSWPANYNRGTGLNNTGNTCFLNSALQCLLHTPPLLRVLIAHKESCRIEKGFCMSCSLRAVAVKSYTTSHAFTPVPITERLQMIAKHMRRGRQEDSHEFLRYAIDALQKSCLAGYKSKMETKLAETTWVHKIFGGRLRSRVTCHDCGYNSDTFDRILDLSLDILRSDSMKDALRKFIAVDYLKGADKYKCEKCKRPVVAEKRFTIHEAPIVLTVHLKRFSPMGRKISHHVDYDDRLTLQPYMSEGYHGPSYSLYGVICHAGGGPNSGHYFAYIKSRDGRWWEMNDEMVTPIGGAPLNKKSAYILFYMREKGQGLEAVVNSSFVTPSAKYSIPPSQKNGLIAGMRKRKERDNESEDKGEKVTKPFIGPVFPASLQSESTADNHSEKSTSDPLTISAQKKMEASKVVKQKAAGLLASLESYNSDDDDESGDNVRQPAAAPSTHGTEKAPLSSTLGSPAGSPLPESAPKANDRKRKSTNSDRESSQFDTRRQIPTATRTPGYRTFESGKNPFNLYAKRTQIRKRRPTGL
ncbi:hypothetical protein AX17_001144 [Amanita inopinata Kibby_2008]|nr:hypothetical protein AX17_001144 [Amanita inopinata Kibby_2008]